MKFGRGPWLAALCWVVSSIGTTVPVQADCSGYVCESICQEGTCGEPHCALAESGGQCECEVKTRVRLGFEIVICRTFGGDCALGCDYGDFPVPLQSEPDQEEGGRLFAFHNTAEMEAALASYSDVLLVLESLRGPGGVPAGEAETKVMLARALPDGSLSDGTLAFEPPTIAGVWFQASGGYLLVEMVFEGQDLIISGEIRRGGQTGIVEIRSADEVLVDRIAW